VKEIFSENQNIPVLSRIEKSLFYGPTDPYEGFLGVIVICSKNL
jgi:hypothetical protein